MRRLIPLSQVYAELRQPPLSPCTLRTLARRLGVGFHRIIPDITHHGRGRYPRGVYASDVVRLRSAFKAGLHLGSEKTK